MRITIWDVKGNYLYGEVEDNYIRIWNQTNDIFYNGSFEGTDIRLFNEERGYLWGRVEGTDLVLWDDQNNLLRGRLEE